MKCLAASCERSWKRVNSHTKRSVVVQMRPTFSAIDGVVAVVKSLKVPAFGIGSARSDFVG